MGSSGCVLGVSSPGRGLHFPTSSEVRMRGVVSMPPILLRGAMLNCAQVHLYFTSNEHVFESCHICEGSVRNKLKI